MTRRNSVCRLAPHRSISRIAIPLCRRLNSYASGALSAVDGPLIEVPYIVTPITIPLVNAPVGTGPQTTTGQAHSVALNDADLCGIFSGKLTNWNQVINPDNNSAYAAGPITVVVRQDSSGTTDLLTRHLAAVCTTGASGNSAIAFTETQTFAATEFAAGLPANFVQASGSSGVANQLKTFATAGTAAVGYLSPDYTNSFLAPSSTAPAASNALPVASLVNANNPGTDVVPTYANASLALSNYAPPIAANASYQAQWIPNAAAPASGYPISGTSNIILSQCYANSAAQSALVNFLNNHYTGASFASIIHGNGFDTVPASYQTAIVANFLSNTSGNYLDIGDSGICTAPVTGR